MRYLYSFLFYLSLPFIFCKLILRAKANPAYKQKIHERFGFYKGARVKQSIWVHAVSLGEVLAAVPLIKHLLNRYPNHSLVVTTMTPTGYLCAKSIFAEDILHFYLPYDTPSAVKNFLTHCHPLLAIIMETELWPNLYHCCHENNIPICLLNARLSEKSYKNYKKIFLLIRPTLKKISFIATQATKDRERFIQLGSNPATTYLAGNIKFDLLIPSDLANAISKLKQILGFNRLVWIAASTHEGEEEIILKAHQKICAINQTALLILVPRHPERFNEVFKISQLLFKTSRRTDNQSIDKSVKVYVGDTLGELLSYYGTADIVFVGGSLVQKGGHNLIEPAALSKPILTGQYLHHFSHIKDLFLANQALQIVDEQNLASKVIALMADRELREEKGKLAYQIYSENQGALQKQLNLLTPIIDQQLQLSFS